MVYKSGLISCDILGANPLDVHVKRVSKYHRDYGSKTWHLLYQAESRFRSEELPGIRRQVIEEKDEIEKSGGNHPFKKDDPWRQVWARAVSNQMDYFWQEEFVMPAMMVRFHLKSIGEVVDGDSPIENHPGSSSSTAALAATTLVRTSYETEPEHQANPPKRAGTRVDRDRTKRKKSLCP